MNIAIFSQRVGRGGGTAGVAFALSRGLAARGHSVRLVAKDVTEVPHGVSYVPWVSPRRLARRARERWIGLDRTAGCDVVRASGGVHALWARVSSRSLARRMQDLRPRPLRERVRERAALTRASVVVCNSIRVMGEVQAWHGVEGARLRLVRNGVDLVRFKPCSEARDRARRAWGARGKVALFMGHGWYRKGLSAAVSAFALISGPDDRLVVMGRDARKTSRTHRARSVLGHKLIVQGPDDPADWLPGADVLLHPTRYDASANAVLESLACGVAPITTARDGAAEIVPVRELVVGDPVDVQGIARAVRYAWGATGMRDRWRGVAEAWPTSRMVIEFETILEDLRDG